MNAEELFDLVECHPSTAPIDRLLEAREILLRIQRKHGNPEVNDLNLQTIITNVNRWLYARETEDELWVTEGEG